MQKTKIDLLKNIILMLVTTLVLFFALEILLRIFYPQELAPPLYALDENVGYRYKPNTTGFHYKPQNFKYNITINSQGFRGPEFPEKGNSSLRIAILGDSFTLGYGVNYAYTYPAQLEKLMRNINKNIEILNFGVGGYDTANEYKIAMLEMTKYNPNIALLTLHSHDEYQNQENEYKFYNESIDIRFAKFGSRKLAFIKQIVNSVPLYTFLAQHSHSVNFIRQTVAIQLVRRPNIDKTTAMRQNKSLAASEKKKEKWVLAYKIIQILDRNLRKEGIILIVIIWPGHPSIDYLTNGFQESSIRFIDLEDVKKVFAKGNKVYFPEGHFNKKGYYLFAKHVNEKLLEKYPSLFRKNID